MKKLFKSFFSLTLIILLSSFTFFLGYLISDYLSPYFPTPNQNTSIFTPTNAPTTINSQTTYSNPHFGFSLELTSDWQDYQAEEVLLGGDFNIAEIKFSLAKNNLFTISVYVKDSWYEPARDTSQDDFLGEVIGQNDQYVFLYSHLNGDPPSSISQRAILDMESIANSIKTFTPENFQPEPTQKVQSESNLSYQNYKNDSVEYWNCNYNYTLYYPADWTNNSPTFSSDLTKFFGQGITASITAQKSNLNLANFVQQQLNSIGGRVTSSRDQTRFGTQIFAYELTNPNVALVFWQQGDYLMEFKIEGSKYQQNFQIIENMIATLTFNQLNSNCK